MASAGLRYCFNIHSLSDGAKWPETRQPSPSIHSTLIDDHTQPHGRSDHLASLFVLSSYLSLSLSLSIHFARPLHSFAPRLCSIRFALWATVVKVASAGRAHLNVLNCEQKLELWPKTVGDDIRLRVSGELESDILAAGCVGRWPANALHKCRYE